MWIGKREKYYQGFDEGKCARCGKCCKLTIDHFIPKNCRMSVNENGNFVGLCKECNAEKANRIVTPEWYKFINEDKKQILNRYMRYAGSYIRSVTNEEEVISYLDRLIEDFKNS